MFERPESHSSTFLLEELLIRNILRLSKIQSEIPTSRYPPLLSLTSVDLCNSQYSDEDPPSSKFFQFFDLHYTIFLLTELKLHQLLLLLLLQLLLLLEVILLRGL